MRTRLAARGAALPVSGVLAWIAWSLVAPTNLPAQSRAGGGSEAPCAIPLAWRVTRVDREYGLGIAEVRAIVQDAVSLWERAAGRPLFVNDETEGFPIRLVYDERQERTQERMRRQVALDHARDEIEVARAELNARVDRHVQAVERHSVRLRDFDARVARHNVVVREWNENGGAPPEVSRELGAVAEALDVERQEIEALGAPIEDEERSIRDAEARLQEKVDEHNERGADLSRDFPPTAVRSGEYREAVQKVGGRVVGVSREIRIYRFASADELRLVVAHELGHAIGLGHLPDAAAVMGEQHETGSGSAGVPTVGASDGALLRATCPDPAGERR